MKKILLLTCATLLALLPTLPKAALAVSQDDPAPFVRSFGPLAQPDPSWSTAEEFLNTIAAGYNPNFLVRWHNDGWDSHTKGRPSNNFPLILGEGYGVGFHDDPVGNPFAALPYDEQNTPNTLTYQVEGGYSFLSIPQKLMPQGQFNAKNLCLSLNNSGGQVSEIKKIESSTIYSTHLCGQSENNFPIEPGVGYLPKSQNYFSWTLSAPPVEKTVSLQIASSFDDVNEEGGKLNPTHQKLWIGTSGNTQASHTGLRLQDLPIPKGATIISAKIELYTPTTQWIPLSYELSGEAVGNSPTFSQTNRPSQRVLTSAKLIHSSNTKWGAKTWQSLEEIRSLVQEIVNRPDWSSGNDLSLIFKGTGGRFSRKFATSFDGDKTLAPKLTVTFQTP